MVKEPRPRPLLGIVSLILTAAVVATTIPLEVGQAGIADPNPARVDPSSAPTVCITDRARGVGWHYGYDMAAIDGAAGLRDYFGGYAQVGGGPTPTPCDDACKAARHTERLVELGGWSLDYDGACLGHDIDQNEMDHWVEFVEGVGPSLDPFKPTATDLFNLSSEAGIISMYCQMQDDPNNATQFVIWLKGFYEGTKNGGFCYGAVIFAASVLAGSAGAILEKAIIGALEGAIKKVAETLIDQEASKTLVAMTLILGRGALAKASPKVATWLAEEAPQFIRSSGGSLAQATVTIEEAAERAAVVETMAPESAAAALEEVAAETPRLTRLMNRFPEGRFGQFYEAGKPGQALASAAENGIETNFERFAERLASSPSEIRTLLTQLRSAGAASSEVDRFFGLRGAPLNPRIVVIGEDMPRVRAFADFYGYEYQPLVPLPENQWLGANRAWINGRMDEGCIIIDIGPSPKNAFFPYITSDFYAAEAADIAGRGYGAHVPIWGLVDELGVL